MSREPESNEQLQYWAARIAVVALQAAVGGYSELLPRAALSIDRGATTVSSHEAALWLMRATKPSEVLSERVGDIAILKITDGESLTDPEFREVRHTFQTELWQHYTRKLLIQAPTDELRVVGGREDITVPAGAFEIYLLDYHLAVGHSMSTTRPRSSTTDTKSTDRYVKFGGAGGTLVVSVEADDQ